MPTVLRIDGLRVVIYPNDHAPAHVHVIGEFEAVFALDAGGVVALVENYGFPARTLTHLRGALTRHRAELLESWRRIHGE